MENFPKHIFFVSDDCEAEFVNEIKGAKIRVANYQYTKARVNNGQIFSLFLSQIDNLQKSGLIKCQ